MSKLIYLVACTVDRFIARKNGSFDFFLWRGEHVADLLSAFPETIPKVNSMIANLFAFHTLTDSWGKRRIVVSQISV